MDAGEFYTRASRALDRLRHIEVAAYEDAKTQLEWDRCGSHVQALRALGAAQRCLDAILIESQQEVSGASDS